MSSAEDLLDCCDWASCCNVLLHLCATCARSRRHDTCKRPGSRCQSSQRAPGCHRGAREWSTTAATPPAGGACVAYHRQGTVPYYMNSHRRRRGDAVRSRRLLWMGVKCEDPYIIGDLWGRTEVGPMLRAQRPMELPYGADIAFHTAPGSRRPLGR